VATISELVRALALRLLARLDARVPVSRAELRVLAERLRHATEPPEPHAPPRWRADLDRELHDEIVDELVGARRRRAPP
jgi:hypothetical protein